MKREEIHARYRQVLEWQVQGLTSREIGERLRLSGTRAQALVKAATRWRSIHVDHLQSDTPVDALHVIGDAIAGLRRRGITTVGQVAVLSDDDLLHVRGIGPAALTQLRADLAARYTEEQGP